LCLQILLNNIDASVELMSEISHFIHPWFDVHGLGNITSWRLFVCMIRYSEWSHSVLFE
jgi:hypothetical protein